ncbi:unnamed protein product [Rotaria sp. Silwood1]|nr:unnamed protein product [Rotaria sp. Silwood1]
MKINISKFSITLSDFTWPKDKPVFPSQRDVYSYLSNYIRQSISYDIFQFNPQAFLKYLHKSDNIIDDLTFQGTFMHISDYRSPEQVRNKRVILVGASMSATEIAANMVITVKHIVHIAPHNLCPSTAVQQIGLHVEHHIHTQYCPLQFSHSDYVEVIHDITQETNHSIPLNTIDIVVPAQYRIDETDKSVLIEIDFICQII